MAEVAMNEDQLAYAEQLMRGEDGVLILEGATIMYRIAGRSVTAVVEIPEKPPEEEKLTIRARLNSSVRPPQLQALDDVHAESVAKLDALLAKYISAGLTPTEGVERIESLNLPFTLEIVNG